VFERMFEAMKQDHAPVGQAPAPDGTYRLVLPVIEPAGLLGAVCCGRDAPLSADMLRDLSTLAAHVSVRLVQLGARAANEQALGRLTRRQSDVALLAAQGRPNAAIATTLGLSENTVKKHLKDIFDELGVTNRTELAIRVGQGDAQLLRLASGDR
jgi:DNA-binding CsgD family transcriptional regulator